MGLGKKAWQTIRWREGAADWLSSRFARFAFASLVRKADEWLLIEWPTGEEAPTKYWLSNLPEDISFRDLVDVTELRWRIERDYQELKQEVGLNHYEGRGWRGFHHHATLCRRLRIPDLREGTIPPSGPHCSAPFRNCRSQRLSTQRIRRCGLNAMLPTESQPCDGASSLHSPDGLLALPCCGSPHSLPSRL